MGLYGLNDFTAFNTLYERIAPKLYGYTLKKVGDPERANEIIQNTFLKIHTHRAKFDPEKSFNTWAFSITNHQIIDYYRKKKLDTREFDEQLHTPPDLFPDPVDITPFLKKLTQLEKETVILRYTKEWDFIDIAQKLGKTESAVRKMVSRSLIKLKDIVKFGG